MQPLSGVHLNLEGVLHRQECLLAAAPGRTVLNCHSPDNTRKLCSRQTWTAAACCRRLRRVSSWEKAVASHRSPRLRRSREGCSSHFAADRWNVPTCRRILGKGVPAYGRTRELPSQWPPETCPTSNPSRSRCMHPGGETPRIVDETGTAKYRRVRRDASEGVRQWVRSGAWLE
jgi:hypothetical protein